MNYQKDQKLTADTEENRSSEEERGEKGENIRKIGRNTRKTGEPNLGQIDFAERGT